MEIEQIRKEFPILDKKVNNKDLIYFDNAATSHKPISVLKAVENYYKTSNSNVNRGLHSLAYESDLLWNDAHKKVSNFLNAESEDEIIFTKNTTEGINLVAQTYTKKYLKEGDVIVITEMEHHSNILPWQQIAKEKKLKLEWIPVLENFELDLEYLDFLIRKYKERLKILSVCYASNVLGVVQDIKYLSKKIHSVGGVICVDAAQVVSHMSVDVKDLDCDFFVFSGHKMYGPMGVGVLYGKKKFLEKLEPWMLGGDMVSVVTKNSVEWSKLPQKFEAGTPNVAGAVGLSESIDWINKVGWLNILRQESFLIDTFLKNISDIPNLKIFGPTSCKKRIGVISFVLENIHPHDIATLLDERGIAVRAGFHCAQPLHDSFDFGPTCRVSFGVYNTKEELDFLINSIKFISNRF